MAQSLQLINGEWVSRPVDVFRAIARAQQSNSPKVTTPPPAPRGPEVSRVGILTQTIQESPFVKFALPAHIRQRKLNDVVFVCENAVHLKEVHVDGTLHHVGTKADFKGKILAARVFGAPRTRVEKDESYRPRMRRKDVHAQRRSTAGDDGPANSLPPEILVLTLDTNSIMFLWAHQAPTEIHFRHQILRLPPGKSPYDRPGSFLAVDPHCRAIAVVAMEGYFVLYSTKSIDDWREEMRQQGDNTPQATLVEDERVISIQGRVMHMEFLAPNREQQQQDATHVILVLFVAHQGKTKITCYDWDTRYNLSTAKPRAERVTADLEDDSPSLIIPLARRSDFLVVCDRHIATYTNILSGTHSRLESPVPNAMRPTLRPGESKSNPRWVQWSRATRNDSYPKEAFYIAREDGRVLYVEVGTSFTHPAPYDAGQLPHSVDKAFACLDIDTGFLNSLQPDVLVSPGVTSDGSVSKVGSFVLDGLNTPYQEVFKISVVEPIPSWTPMSDMTIAKLPGSERRSILAASGCAPHGGITELRRGIQARVDGCVGGFAGSNNMWILHRGVEEAPDQSHMQYDAIVLVNIPPESLLFKITRSKRAWNGWEQITGDDNTGVLREETISASMITENLTVQITRSEARTLTRPGLTLVDSISFHTPILAAASHSRIPFIIVTYRDKHTSQPTLRIVKIEKDGRFSSTHTVELESEPTCVDILDEDAVFVAFADGLTSIIMVDVAGAKIMCDTVLKTHVLPGVCESATLLRFRDERTVLYGTRDGALVSFSLRGSRGRLAFYDDTANQMGTTPVRVLRSATDASVAFVSCGKDFCRVHHHKGSSLPVIDSVWFTDREDPSFQQDAVTAVDQFPPSDQQEDLDQNFTGYFFAISGDKFLIAQLDYERGPQTFSLQGQKAVPRSYPTKATPLKFLYSQSLRKLIVHAFEPVEKRQPPHGYRTVKSKVQLLEPDASRRSDTHGEVIASFDLEKYERVNSMVEWETEREGKKYHVLIVGTSAVKSDERTSGRLLYLQVRRGGIVPIKAAKEFDAPVECMTLWNWSPWKYEEDRWGATLFFAVGMRLYMENYDNEKKKWVSRGNFPLTSRATHISVSAIRIFDDWLLQVYVSTIDNSLLCFQIVRESDGDEFKQVFTDPRGRNLTQHLTITFEHDHPEFGRMCETTILADKTCGLSGVMSPLTVDGALGPNARTAFEAHLPRSITRLRRGNIRPPWRIFSATMKGSMPAGVIANDIVASCSDGTVYGLTILNEPALRILKILQNLIKFEEARTNKACVILRQESTTRDNRFANILHSGSSPGSDSLRSPPYKRPELLRLGDVDPGEASHSVPKKFHVDADVLRRYFDGRVTGEGLKQLVLTNTTSSAVAGRLRELAMELLDGEPCPAYGMSHEINLDGIAGWVQWVIHDIL